MNLADILDAVQREVGHKPGNRAHRDDVARKVNANYLDLLTGVPWEFREDIFELQLEQELEYTSGLSLNNKRIVFAVVPAAAGNFLGATLIVENSGIGMDGRHAVVRDDGTGTIWIETDTGVSLGSDPGATYTFRWYEYPLPGELEDVLGIMSRTDDYGEIPLIDRTSERAYMLNDDDEAGTPGAAMLTAPQRTERPPRQVLTAAESAGAGLASGNYSYLYRYLINGRFSGRSNIVSVEVTGGTGNRVTLDGLEDWTGTPDLFPARRYLYREDVDTAPGIFRLIAILDSTSTTGTTYIDTGLEGDDDNVYREAGPYRSLRFWPRADERKILEVQYHRRAERLLHDLDVPAFPETYHELLVHQVVSELAARNNDTALSGFHEKRANSYVARMRARYLSQRATRHVRRGRPEGRGRYAGLQLTVKDML